MHLRPISGCSQQLVGGQDVFASKPVDPALDQATARFCCFTKNYRHIVANFECAQCCQDGLWLDVVLKSSAKDLLFGSDDQPSLESESAKSMQLALEAFAVASDAAGN